MTNPPNFGTKVRTDMLKRRLGLTKRRCEEQPSGKLGSAGAPRKALPHRCNMTIRYERRAEKGELNKPMVDILKKRCRTLEKQSAKLDNDDVPPTYTHREWTGSCVSHPWKPGCSEIDRTPWSPAKAQET